MENIEKAYLIVDQLYKKGIKDFCVAGGSRNAPLIAALSKYSGEDKDLKIYSHFDERALSFFALGIAQSKSSPVATFVTSGTAVSEQFSAVIEAYYQGLALVVVSADRPQNFRKTAAPQAINQQKIFGDYVKHYTELSDTKDFDTEIQIASDAPSHINVCFDEPVLGNEISEGFTKLESVSETLRTHVDFAGSEYFKALVSDFKKPLVVVGSLGLQDAQIVSSVLKSWNLPVLADATSQLYSTPGLTFVSEYNLPEFSSVIRIGSVPSFKLWRNVGTLDLDLVSISNLSFWGTEKKHKVFDLQKISEFKEFFGVVNKNKKSLVLANNVNLDEYPSSRLTLLSKLSNGFKDSDFIYWGNSLSIRDAALLQSLFMFGDVELKHRASRGANGIDGQISSYLGSSVNDISSWCVLGDVTCLYDLNAPYFAKQLKGVKRIVVVNNGGGKIFERLPYFSHVDLKTQSLMETRHNLGFRSWAEMWGFSYLCVAHESDLTKINLDKNIIIELRVDDQQDQKLEESLKDALAFTR